MKKKHQHKKQGKAGAAAQGDLSNRTKKYVQQVATYWAKCFGLLIFLLLWTWFVGSQMGWWQLSNTRPTSGLSSSGGSLASADGDQNGADTRNNSNTTNRGGGGSSTTNTTTNNTTINNPAPDPKPDPDPGPDPDPDPNPSCTTTIPEFFDAIFNGQTKEEVFDLACQIAPNCLDATTVILGTQQLCTFREGNEQVVAIFLNGELLTKIKSGF